MPVTRYAWHKALTGQGSWVSISPSTARRARLRCRTTASAWTRRRSSAAWAPSPIPTVGRPRRAWRPAMPTWTSSASSAWGSTARSWWPTTCALSRAPWVADRHFSGRATASRATRFVLVSGASAAPTWCCTSVQARLTRISSVTSIKARLPVWCAGTATTSATPSPWTWRRSTSTSRRVPLCATSPM